MKIYLTPRLGRHSAQPIRGDRTIRLEGKIIGHVEMISHGCHGPSYKFLDALGSALVDEERFEGRIYHRSIEVKSLTRHDRRRGVDVRTTEQRIIDRAKELIEAGRLPPLDEIKAAREKAARESAARRDAREKDETIKKRLMRELYARSANWMTADERVAFAWTYAEAFSGDIESC